MAVESRQSMVCRDPNTLRFVNQNLKNLFQNVAVGKTPPVKVGRIKYFHQNWKILSGDPNILEIVSGWKLPMRGRPCQAREPKEIPMSKAEQKVVDNEIKSMLEKGVIREVEPVQGQFLSTIFVRPKKEAGKFRPIINLKRLNQYMPYAHFKMEGLKNIKELLNHGDYMVKIDLKDAYWHIPIHPSCHKLLRFHWRQKLYEMTVLAFGVGPGPRIFTKLMKVPLTVLRRLMIKIIAYLDDLLIIGRSKEEALQARDSVKYLS